jgi:hypothetical protein
VQYDILCKNAILCELAKEVPWKNLLDLFTLKFYGVGDVLWRHGDHPMELAFVLCGGFLARHMRDAELSDPQDPFPSHARSSGEKKLPEQVETIVAERLLKPGASLAVYAVDQSTPLRYTVVTAKFKSILIALPIGKFKSVLRQLTPATKAAVQQLILENETKLCTSLQLLPPKTRRGLTAFSPRHPTSPLKKSYSTPNLVIPQLHATSMAEPTVHALNRAIHTASWDSLQVKQPVEYEVNSSLLILHDSGALGRHHIPSTGHSASEQLRAKLLRGTTSSSVVRTTAKKHTTRRLQSIKLPAAMDAFPLPLKRDGDMEAQVLEAASLSGAHSLDVVPKIRIGRLLAPIKKPAMVEREDDICMRRGIAAGAYHTNLQEPPLVGRIILLANRDKPFREEA